jgi:hypothetical protein
MRVLLQNTETNLYFIQPNGWTDEPLKATDFEEVAQAAAVYHAQDLAYARIVVEPGLPADRAGIAEEILKHLQPGG